jgi:hypothetical protein
VPMSTRARRLRDPNKLWILLLISLALLDACEAFRALRPMRPEDRFADNGDGTITDQLHGLTWEKKSDDGSIHDKDKVYVLTGSSIYPRARDGLLDQLNSSPCFGGYCDWRIPSYEELRTIVDRQTMLPAVHQAFNQNCMPGCSVEACSCMESGKYWSSTDSRTDACRAWVVSFTKGDGDAFDQKTGTPHHVRAVRDHAPDPPGDRGNGQDQAAEAESSSACWRRTAGGLNEQSSRPDEPHEAAEPGSRPDDRSEDHHDDPAGDAPGVQLTEARPEQREDDRCASALGFSRHAQVSPSRSVVSCLPPGTRPEAVPSDSGRTTSSPARARSRCRSASTGPPSTSATPPSSGTRRSTPDPLGVSCA